MSRFDLHDLSRVKELLTTPPPAQMDPDLRKHHLLICGDLHHIWTSDGHRRTETMPHSRLSWFTMVTVRRFRVLAVIAVTLVIFGVGLAALSSTGGGTGQAPGEGYAVTTTTFGSQVPTNRVSPLRAPSVSGSVPVGSEVNTVVPDAVGMRGRVSRASQPAVALIDSAMLNATLSTQHFGGNGARWSVVSQSPSAGSIVPIGSAVVLTMRYG